MPVLLSALPILFIDYQAILEYLGSDDVAGELLSLGYLTSYLLTIFTRDIFNLPLKSLEIVGMFEYALDLMEGGDYTYGDTMPTRLLRTLKKWRKITASQLLDVGEAIFIAQGIDLDQQLGMDDMQVVSMAGTLGSRLSAISSQYSGSVTQGEATAEAVSTYATLLFGSRLSKDIVDFLDGRRTVRIPIDESAMPSSLFKDTPRFKLFRQDNDDDNDSSNGKGAWDCILIATGILTTKELEDASSYGGEAWKAVLDSILQLARDFYDSTLGDMLHNGGPTVHNDASELESFFLGPDDKASDTADKKWTKFIEIFGPLVGERLMKDVVREFVSSGVLQGLEPNSVQDILTKQSPLDQWKTVERTLIGVRPGEYNANLGFSGHLILASTDSYRFVAEAKNSAEANLSVTTDNQQYTFKPQSRDSQVLVTTRVTLTGSQVYKFSASAHIQGLQWRASQVLQQAVPVDGLVDGSTTSQLGTSLNWLARYKLLIERLQLVPCEVEPLGIDLSWPYLDFLMSYVDLRTYIVSQQNQMTTVSAVAGKLLSVFPLRLDSSGSAEARYTVKDVINATGWSEDDIRPYASFTPSDRLTWQGVLQVRAQLPICKTLGVLIDDVYRWVYIRTTHMGDERRQQADELALPLASHLASGVGGDGCRRRL